MFMRRGQYRKNKQLICANHYYASVSNKVIFLQNNYLFKQEDIKEKDRLDMSMSVLRLFLTINTYAYNKLIME